LSSDLLNLALGAAVAGTVALAVREARVGTHCRHEPSPPPPLHRTICFAGFCFPPDVIVLSVRWYLRFGLSCRDVEELLAERGVEVDHVTAWGAEMRSCSSHGVQQARAANLRDCGHDHLGP